MTNPTAQTPPANWYPDPQNSASERYWDGTAWTVHVRPTAPAFPPPQIAQPVAQSWAPAPQPNAFTYTQESVSRRNIVGWVALGLVLLGTVIALIPDAFAFAFVVLIAGFITSIVALARKQRGKGAGITALVLSLVGGGIATFMMFASFVGYVTDDSNSPQNQAAEAPASAVIGETVTNDDGVAFTVTKSQCGIDSVTDPIFDTEEEPTGDFCKVVVNIDNGSSEQITVSTSDLTGYIGNAEYQPDSGLSVLGKDYVLTNVNPGLSIKAVLYLDVPKGAELDAAALNTTWAFDGDVKVALQ